jgi:hypothetical protein
MNRLLIIAAAWLLLLPVTALSQTRNRSSRQKPSATATTTATAQQATAIRNEGAARIAVQIKNLTAFLYRLGGVAKGLEELDAAAKAANASPAVVQQNEQSKARIKASFTDFRVGLDNLEIYFRSTPGLQSYYLKLAGSAEGAANGEALAGAGQFDRAGRSLLGVVDRLTDTLATMR